MCLSLAWLRWPSQFQPKPNRKVSTIDMETIISRFYHIIQMITTHSAIHLVRCCHGQMSLIAVSYPIIFTHDLYVRSIATLAVETLVSLRHKAVNGCLIKFLGLHCESVPHVLLDVSEVNRLPVRAFFSRPKMA